MEIGGDHRHPRRAGLRLRQRLPRRRQLDRHGRVDPRAVASLWRSSGRRSSTSSPSSSSARDVADTIANDVVVQSVLTVGVIFAGLLGAIAWNLLTFWLGLPTSSSHALVGGMAGAAVVRGGFDVLISEGLATIGAFIVLSPLVGLAIGLLLTVIIQWVFHREQNLPKLNKGFRRGQLVLGGRVQPGTWRQ